MKAHARLFLPPLATLNDDSLIQYARLERDGQIQSCGQASLQQLALMELPLVHVILHPEDAVVADIKLPRLSRKRLEQAVTASLEPMLLDNLEQVIVAHSAQDRDSGHVQVAWVDRQHLLQAWARLIAAGLPPKSIIAQGALPAMDADSEPSTTLWRSAWPNWSLADTALRPQPSKRRWQQAGIWLGGAAALWIIGLNLYAARLSAQMQALSSHIESTVKSAFPEIPVLLDPLSQANKQLSLLRQQTATPDRDAFSRLALAAAQIPEFAQGRVQSIHYQPGLLRLEVLPQSNTLERRYAAPGAHAVGALTIEKDPHSANTWLIRATPPTSQEAGR